MSINTSASNKGSSQKNTMKKAWTTLITNTAFLPGLLTLEYSLRRINSKYPLLVLYTDSFPADGHSTLNTRATSASTTAGPSSHPFSLVEYERVVQLDSDMVVLQNIDELMDLELVPPGMGGAGNRVFAASHACVCNPLHKVHYPKDWVPTNCAYTAQTQEAPPTTGLGIPNGGLQSLLADLFYGRWVALPYVYNALKTLRWEGVHDSIWRDENLKNVHYILSPKPWDDGYDDGNQQLQEPLHEWWFAVNQERLKEERNQGLE
ncbi:nucleotide-diphospho-sugar transferase [Aspergillus varians]